MIFHPERVCDQCGKTFKEPARRLKIPYADMFSDFVEYYFDTKECLKAFVDRGLG